jgi:hypothetical protein
MFRTGTLTESFGAGFPALNPHVVNHFTEFAALAKRLLFCDTNVP